MYLFESIMASTCSNVEALYPTPNVRPDYICIDKGCMVLHTIGIWVSHPSCDICLYTVLICTHLLTGSIILGPWIPIHTAITNGSWNIWKETTQFIVDSYHYINHCASDYFCCKWRNPAPLNGSAPNLVVVEHDVNGNAHYKRAFNTQACFCLYVWMNNLLT